MEPPATDIYPLSLHDALPICQSTSVRFNLVNTWKVIFATVVIFGENDLPRDRKSTRLNSSHLGISYAVYCLKKKRSSLRDLQSAGEGLHRQLLHRRRGASGRR